MPRTESSIDIRGLLQEVFALACDMQQYPTFMPDVDSVTILAKTDHTTTTEWEANVEGTPVIWIEEDTFYGDPDYRISYKLIEGDFDVWEGEWHFTQIDPETVRVALSVEFDFGIPNLTELIGPTLEVKVRENSESMLQGMKRYIEGLSVVPIESS